MIWHKKVDGRSMEGYFHYARVEVDEQHHIWVTTYRLAEGGAGGADQRGAAFTVDMARNLRAAIDEAIERANVVG